MPEPSRHPLLRELPPLALLLVVWLLLCGRVFAHFFDQVYLSAIDDDALDQFWIVWWAGQALSSSELSLFHCPWANHPLGMDVLVFSPAYFLVMLAGKLQPLLGTLGAINGVFAGALLASALASYFFLRQVTRWQLKAAVLAVIPLIHVTRDPRGYLDMERANFALLALSLGLWLRLLRRGGWWLAILTGLSAGLCCAMLMYYGISLYLLLGLGALCCVLGWGPSDLRLRESLRHTGLALGIGALVVLPMLWPSLSALSDIGVFHAPGPEWIVSYQSHWRLLILLPLAGLAWSCSRTSKRIWFWFLGVALLLILSLDAWLELGETGLGLPPPLQLLKRLFPFFWRLNSPHRFGWMCLLPLAALLAASEGVLRSRLAYGARRRYLVLGALFLLGSSCGSLLTGQPPQRSLLPPLAPIPVQAPPQVPQLVRDMAQDPEPYAVLDLSCQKRQWSAYFQTIHGKPIAGFGIVPDHFAQAQERSELTQVLDRVCSPQRSARIAPPAADPVYQRHDVRYAILHLAYGPPLDRLPQLERSLGSPVHEDEQVRIYRLSDAR